MGACISGYVPLRVGHARPSNNNNSSSNGDESASPIGYTETRQRAAKAESVWIRTLTMWPLSLSLPLSLCCCCSTSFSLDTLLWNEKLLEDRLTALNAWTRRSPPTQRQQLDRINWLVNHCNTTT